MRRVGDHGNLDIFVRHSIQPLHRSAKMVLDVARSFFVRLQLGIELTKQLF